MVIEFPPDDRVARFNSGVDKLYRIGALKRGCHDARVYNNFELWFSCLQGIRSEMNSKLTLTPNQKKKETESERSIAGEYENAAQSWFDRREDEVITIRGKRGKVKDLNIKSLLYEYELWLGDMEEKYKFGMPDMDSAMEALK